MKKQVSTLDATPSKRLYLSIIADYDINRGLCELADNALDIWTKNGRTTKLTIDIFLDTTQQTITVSDDAGGINKENLSNVVGPGHTSNLEKDATIGIFGVGTKRAVVALAQEVRIKTRRFAEPTYQVEFTDAWFEDNDDWELPVYEVSEIEPNSTIVELSRLRTALDDAKIASLRKHLGATYSQFLSSTKLTICLNNSKIVPIDFEKWAYPPGFEPRRYSGILKTNTGEEVHVTAIAGLTRESKPSSGEYGVYVYCNDRLIAPELKTLEVGFTTGLAGKPHPDISLTRVLIFLSGPARLMPWNSSKSDINPSNEIFLAIRNWLIHVVKDYASLSRRFNKLEGGWPENVFKYDSGTIQPERVGDFRTANTSYLPPLPESKPRRSEMIVNANRALAKDKPWVRGLYESIIAVNLILKQHLEQRNRIGLILLDSTLEIAFKEYLVYESGIVYSDEKLQGIFKDRRQVHQQVKQSAFSEITAAEWLTIEYYYKARCDLIHRRANSSVSDTEIQQYEAVVIRVLQKLFGLQLTLD